MNTEKTVLLGMSGGVDSSVAAYLLQQQGYKVIGVTMQIYAGGLDDVLNKQLGCYGPNALKSVADAKEIADQLGIKHYVIPLVSEYQQEVLNYFRSEYLLGRTPNPCVRCNQMLKFGFLIEKAAKIGLNFDYVATGHYCRIVEQTGERLLLRAKDLKKDQSYFLSRLKKEQLNNLIFPLGDYTKEEIKEVALQAGWQTLAKKHESQDFVSADNYSILFDKKDIVSGDVRDTSGKLLGKHSGLVNYTIGQRKGLGIGGAAQSLYVIKIDVKNNTLIVGAKDELLSGALMVSKLNWFKSGLPQNSQVQVKIRYTAQPVLASVSVDMRCCSRARVVFSAPQISVTPGQVAVFYDNNCVIGSGIID